jgi:uncharacterized protein YndB with AHSA1/START domain
MEVEMATRKLIHSVEIEAPPEVVWDWLAHMAERYPEWHPDHEYACWNGVANQPGSVMTIVERLGGRREQHSLELTHYEPPRRFAYRMRGPVSMLLPCGEFRIDPVGDGSRFTAAICYRGGGLTERLYARRIRALRRHMREEGESLKHLLEVEPLVVV